ncbi:MAG: exodeoxyribonuclease I, partial [Pseudomonadales bacterium]|nr:exodeoxyribonuclease I [Pseudomonadales bacterium]
DPDLMLYQGGFFSNTDKAMMAEIHDIAPDVLRDHAPPFQDERLPEMLFRFRARNYPESLSDEELGRWNAYRRMLWRNGELIDERLAEIDALIEDNATDCLADLRSYILSLKAEIYGE